MQEKIIEIRGLDFSYPDGTAALSGINLDISRGDCVGIIGPNGAGKSTLLLHFNGVLRSNGSVKVLDMEVNDDNIHRIRRKVGLVFQDPDNQLFMPTVYDDVSFGPINMGLKKEEVNSRVQQALEKVDMLYALAKSSHHLSVGEKKRVSIATVLSMGPEILVLDEPTSNLDPKHRRQLINFLKSISFTKIIATHDLNLVLEICTRVAFMDKGSIIFDTKIEDVLKNREILENHGFEIT